MRDAVRDAVMPRKVQTTIGVVNLETDGSVPRQGIIEMCSNGRVRISCGGIKGWAFDVNTADLKAVLEGDG